MKTFQKLLCVMLSILMAMSCLSVAAFAADGEKFTSTYKLTTTVSNKNSAGVVLDELDKILKDMDIHETVDLKVAKLDFDITSVNALCDTIDNYDGILKVVIAADFTGAILGDLSDINLKTWKNGLSRPNNDIEILSEFIELIAANKNIIKKLCAGSIDLGIFADYIDLNDLLGPDGVSGLLKELLLGLVYDDTSSAYNTYKNDMDSFIYTKLLPSFIEDYLPGLTVNTSATIDSLLIDIYNICLEKYIKPELKELDIDLSSSDVPELKALAKVLNLKGSTYNYSNLAYSRDNTFKAQINTVIGNYIKNMVPAYTGWVSGGYDKFNTNIEKVIRYVAKTSGIIANADKKSIEQIGVEIAVIILRNADFGAYETGLESCKTLEEMATALLINTANEMEIGVSYTGKESYLVVAGDIFASWAYDNFAFTDYNGKIYRPGGGKDIFEVANYFANYFLFDRGGAAALGLSTTKQDSIFTKLDKLVDFFGKDKAVNFSTEGFLLGASGKKGLIDCVLTLDIGSLLNLTIVPILDKAGPTHAVEFIYNTVQYFLKSWAGKAILPAYQTKAFTNALSKESIGNMIEAFLETVNARKADIITLATFITAIVLRNETAEYTLEATMSALTATGKALTPKATVKANGKTLTQNTDYIILADTATAPGTYNAKIKGIGLYSGEIERSFTVSMDKVKTLSYTSTKDTVKLTWSKVPYAKSYTVTSIDSGKKVTVTNTSYSATGLSAGKEYKFSVQAVGPDGKATTAKEITVYTVPAAVSSSKLKATPSVSSVKLSWSAVSGATHYKVEKYASGKWSTVSTVTGTSLTVSGLSGYTSYKFRVTALKKLPDGTYLAASPATVTAKTKLGTPSSLTATSTAKTITLTWKKVTNAEKYQIQQYTGGEWKTLGTTSSATYKITSKQISKIKAATKYKLAVRAMVKENGKWVYGERKEITKYTGLATPSSVKVSSSSVTTTSAKLSWKKVTGASNYEVYAYIGGKWKKMGSTKKTAMTVKELPAGKKTKLKVRAVAKLGGETVKSSFSSEVTALTLVSKVTSLKAAERKTTSIKLSWKKVTGATSYQVYRYTNGKWKKIGTTTKTTYTDSKSLEKGTEYKYKVRAVQKVSSKTTRYGAYSSVLKAKTTRIGTARF